MITIIYILFSMSNIRKLNKIPIVVQKVDPKMLDLKKKNVDMQIAIHKLNKIIEDQQKKLKKSQSIIKKMDCIIDVLCESSSNDLLLFCLIINLEMSDQEILEKAKEERKRRKKNAGAFTILRKFN